MRYVREPTWEEDDDLLAFSTPRNRFPSAHSARA